MAVRPVVNPKVELGGRGARQAASLTAVNAHAGEFLPGLSFAQCLSQHGYALWATYQPASRFWLFQWIEGGWLLALSVLLISGTVWLVQRWVA